MKQVYDDLSYYGKGHGVPALREYWPPLTPGRASIHGSETFEKCTDHKTIVTPGCLFQYIS